MDADDTPALAALREAGIAHDVLRHGPVRSLAEAADARGVEPADVVKTLVVRRGDDDFLMVRRRRTSAVGGPRRRQRAGAVMSARAPRVSG